MVRSSLLAGLALAASARVAAADVTLVKGGPKGDRALLDTALLDAERAMSVCWRGAHPAKIKVTLAVAGDGAVAATAATKGGAAQCAAGVLAVWTLPGGAWTGDVEIVPAGVAASADLSAVIQKQLLGHAADLKACQAAAPSAVGSVTIQMMVGDDGTISDVKTTSKLGAAIDGCVARAVGKLRLDPLGGGGAVRYQLAVAFAGGSGGAKSPPVEAPDPAGGAVGGSLGASAVKDVMTTARARLVKCGAQGKTKGTLTVRWTIRADGTTKNIVVKEAIGDAAIEGCVTKLIGGLTFAKSSGETRVSYPLAFR